MDSAWRTELLGRLRASQRERVITHFRTQKTAALLAYLAYHRAHPHPRGTFMELLWPEQRVEPARRSLSVELSWLRRQLQSSDGPSVVLVTDQAPVQLNPELVTTDVAEFNAALDAAARAINGDEKTEWLVQAVELYRGELLPGYFDDWVLQERSWLAERYFQALSELLSYLEKEGDLQRALRYAHHGVSVDPLREEAHHDLIRLYAAARRSS
jgi:DNA-binding SARP family transcriptional activator